MLQFRHKTIIAISGVIWFAIGLMLLRKGLNLLAIRGDQFAVILIAAGLVIGFLKGRTIMSKTARKGIARISGMKEPMPIVKMYAPRFYVLIGLMMMLGMSLKYFGLSHDLRGTVDVAIGSALLNGSTVYFRYVRG